MTDRPAVLDPELDPVPGACIGRGTETAAMASAGDAAYHVRCTIEGVRPHLVEGGRGQRGAAVSPLLRAGSDLNGDPCLIGTSWLFKYMRSAGAFGFEDAPRLVREPVIFPTPSRCPMRVRRLRLTSE